MSLYLDEVKNCTGLTDSERKKLCDLLDMWHSKLERNKLKTCYYEAKEGIKNLGIAVPEEFTCIDTVIGWPAKAVDYLAQRSIFDGFVYNGQANEIVEYFARDNDLTFEYIKAATSELTNSCVFATVSRGGSDEPEVVMNLYSAETSTALWNYRKKRIDWGLVVTDIKRDPKTRTIKPVQIMMHSDFAVYEINGDDNSKWTAKKMPHIMGRPMMVCMAYKPTLKRPFGKSRISRTVMSLTDCAIRARLRAEIGSEFYTTPQKYLLGADDEAFDIDRWSAYAGHIFLASRDENGDLPHFGQLPQATMQPHTEYMRDLAAQFAGETNLPISSLGVIHDNPASAEAIYAAKEDLILDAQLMNEANGRALCQLAQMAICVKENKAYSELSDDDKAIAAHFKNPAAPSIVTQANAMVQACAPAPWIAETDVYLEELGFDEPTRRRLMDAKAKSEARAMIAAQMQQPEQKSATMYEIASIIKSYRAGKISRRNAITLFEQIGVDEEEASSMLDDAKDISETIDDAGAVDEQTVEK